MRTSPIYRRVITWNQAALAIFLGTIFALGGITVVATVADHPAIVLGAEDVPEVAEEFFDEEGGPSPLCNGKAWTRLYEFLDFEGDNRVICFNVYNLETVGNNWRDCDGWGQNNLQKTTWYHCPGSITVNVGLPYYACYYTGAGFTGSKVRATGYVSFNLNSTFNNRLESFRWTTSAVC